jgi:hypothetical protein
MRNCSGVRMASHSSSDFCTGPGVGADDDIATTAPGNRRPSVLLEHRPAAGLTAGQYAREHEREAGRGADAAAGEGARRRDESAESGRVAGGAAGWAWRDAILSFSRCWTPIFFSLFQADVAQGLSFSDADC